MTSLGMKLSFSNSVLEHCFRARRTPLKLRLWVIWGVILGLTAPVTILADVKVGFVNIAAIMEKAPQAEAAAKALEREFSARDSALTADRDAIIELENKLKRDGEVMSESRRVDLERKILKRKREFNRAKDELKEDFNIRRNEELGQLQRQVYAVIVDLAKSEKYDLMVTERVLYASDRIDITDKVLKRLKATFKKPSR
jgi:outer membrane protein